MSVHAAGALIGWTSSGSFHNYFASMEGGENHEPTRFCIEVNVPRGGWKLAVLQLHHGATPEGAVGATVDLCCLNQLFGDMLIYSV